MSFAPLPNFQPSYLQGYVPKGTSVWEKVLAGAVGAGVNEAASSGVSALMSKYIDDPEAEAKLDEIRARIGLLGAQTTAVSEKPPSDFENERTRQLFLENNLTEANLEKIKAEEAEILKQKQKEAADLASRGVKAADDGKTWFDRFMNIQVTGEAADETESNLFKSAKEIWSNPESSPEQKEEAAKILNRAWGKNSEGGGQFKLSKADIAWLRRFKGEPDEPASMFNDHVNYFLFGPQP